MVAHLLRLKLTLLRNALRRSTLRLVTTLLAWIWGLGTAGLLVLSLVFLRGQPVELAGPLTTLLGAALLLGWAVVPVLAFGVDETLDPARFATFGLRRRQLLPGLLLAGLVGVPGAVTVLLASGTVVTWSRGPLAVAVALVCAPLAVASCLVVARAFTTLAAGVLASRRTRELGGGVAVVALMFVGLLPALLGGGSVRLDADSLAGTARLAGWTPLGWLWSAPWDAASGQPGAAALKVLLGAALLAALAALWAWATERQLTRPPSSGTASVRGTGALLGRLTGPTGAVTARSLRYWRRDSRYVTSLVTVLAMPLLLGAMVLLDVMGFRTGALLLAPLVAGLIGWGLHNDVAYDGSAVWAHVAAGVPGTADRAGRVLAALVWAVPVVLTMAVAGVAVAERWDLLPAVAGLALALLGVGAGVSSVASVLAPYPVPEAGSNPFSTPSGSAVQTMVAQMVTSAATLVGTLPVLVAAVVAWRAGSQVATWLALGLGLAVGVAGLLTGVRVGGRMMDRRGPELLARVR